MCELYLCVLFELVYVRLRKFVTIITTSTEGTTPIKSYASKLFKVKTADSTMCVTFC